MKSKIFAAQPEAAPESGAYHFHFDDSLQGASRTLPAIRSNHGSMDHVQ